MAETKEQIRRSENHMKTLVMVTALASASPAMAQSDCDRVNIVCLQVNEPIRVLHFLHPMPYPRVTWKQHPSFSRRANGARCSIRVETCYAGQRLRMQPGPEFAKAA
jgi:hypothetical protein